MSGAMDEELKAIQADLDSVLDRLAAYMSTDKLKTEHCEPKVATAEEVAQVVSRYIDTLDLTQGQLDEAIHRTRRTIRFWRNQSEKIIQDDHGDPLGNLQVALMALEGWIVYGGPLNNRHLFALWCSASAFQEGAVEYFGQEVGLPLVPKRKVDRRKYDRRDAVRMVWKMNKEDPQSYPIGEGLFGLVGKSFGMSASVVKRAYYSEEARAFRERWSKYDEN